MIKHLMQLLKKDWQTILVSALVILFIIFLAILSLLYDNKVNGNWVTMLAGFWSAIATVTLGFIAVWQNKRYKDLSDDATKNTERVQQEIRDLTNKTVEAIEVLKKIEIAKYYPTLNTGNRYYYHINGEIFKREFSPEKCSIQPTLINLIDQDDLTLANDELA